MLKVLRHRGVQRKIFIGLAVAIIPSFVFWGAMVNEEDGKTAGPLGKIGGRKVTVTDYLNAYRAVQHQMQFMFGERWGEMRRFVNLKGEAWDRILLLEDAKRRGIRTSDREVVDWIAGQPGFQRQGKYYPEIYRLTVREYLRMEPRDFEEEIRNTLTVEKLSKKIIETVHAGDAELREIFDKERAARDLDYAVLSISETGTGLTVDDKEIEDAYAAVKDRLTDPERVQLSYLFVPKDQAEAKKDVLADNASDLQTLASKAGLETKTTDFFSRNEAVPEIGLSKEILEAAFSLPVEGESPWIALEQGSFKIRVAAKRAERPLTMDEAREELKKQVLKGKSVQAALERLNDLKPAVEKDGFEAAVRAAGLEVRHFDGYKPDVYLPGIGPGSLVERQVRAMKEGETSSALAVTDGAALVRVKKSRAPSDADFEKEKENFRKEIVSRKSQDAMRDLLEKLRGGLQLNMEKMREIFPEEETTPASAGYPSVPS